MHIPQFTYFNVVVQRCQRHTLSLGAGALRSSVGCRDHKQIGERGESGTCICVSACCVVFNQEHWKRWIETQREDKKKKKTSRCSSLHCVSPHITGVSFVLLPLMFLYCCWREICWLRCCALLSHLWSWLLHESRQRGVRQKQLIGICWAWLTSNPSHLLLYVFAQVLKLDGHLWRRARNY